MARNDTRLHVDTISADLCTWCGRCWKWSKIRSCNVGDAEERRRKRRDRNSCGNGKIESQRFARLPEAPATQHAGTHEERERGSYSFSLSLSRHRWYDNVHHGFFFLALTLLLYFIPRWSPSATHPRPVPNRGTSAGTSITLIAIIARFHGREARKVCDYAWSLALLKTYNDSRGARPNGSRSWTDVDRNNSSKRINISHAEDNH